MYDGYITFTSQQGDRDCTPPDYGLQIAWDYHWDGLAADLLPGRPREVMRYISDVIGLWRSIESDPLSYIIPSPAGMTPGMEEVERSLEPESRGSG